jgi:K+-dependent Na+/Ca+ exchanger-like protein
MIALSSLAVMVAAIYLLSVVTDGFFIPSLDRIATRCRMPADVAGASLMAMGSSAPELSIALFALFGDGGAHSDVGIGTIVGSAVFNILIITGFSAMVREARITLPAIVRDTVFYLVSILVLLVVFWDGRVTVPEGLLFVTIYVVYLGFLFLVPLGAPVLPAAEAATAVSTPGTSGFARLNQAVGRGVGWLAGDPEQAYLRAFAVSVAFIIVLSKLLVDMALLFSDAVGLPPVVVALTLLAGGTSAPDLIASMVVARQGRGSMAVANAIGSNIFDILVGLGLPWLIAMLFLGRPDIAVGTGDLMLSVVILMGTVLVLFGFLYTDRTLSRREGVCLVGLYLLYVGWTVAVG